MIDFVNEILQFDFVVDSYIPILIRVLIFTAILFITAVILEALIHSIKSKLINNILLIFEVLVVAAACTFLIISSFMLFILPVLLCIVAVKFSLMHAITGCNEFTIGLISILICLSALAGFAVVTLKE